jgi:hypothetical protein
MRVKTEVKWLRMCVFLMAKIILQQIAIKYKLPDRNALPYRRYKPEPLLESANMILYWVRSVVTDKTLDVNRPDTVPIVRGNKTAFVIDAAVLLTHNFPKPRQRKLRSMKTCPWK